MFDGYIYIHIYIYIYTSHKFILSICSDLLHGIEFFGKFFNFLLVKINHRGSDIYYGNSNALNTLFKARKAKYSSLQGTVHSYATTKPNWIILLTSCSQRPPTK